MAPSTPSKAVREPIRMPALWVTLIVVILIGIPAYWTTGGIDPIVLGIPLWFWFSILGSIAFASVLSYACMRLWNLAEPAEEAAESDRVDGEPR